MPSKAQPRGLRWLRQGIGLAVIPISIILIRLAFSTIAHDTVSTAEPTPPYLQAATTPPRELPDIVADMNRLDDPGDQELAAPFTRLISGGDSSAPRVTGVYRDTEPTNSLVIITQSSPAPGSVPSKLVTTAMANAHISDSEVFPMGPIKGVLRCGSSSAIGVVCVWADHTTEIAIDFDKSTAYIDEIGRTLQITEALTTH
jgi:hypothetical protein